MTSIAHWAERPPPIDASASIAVAKARFAEDASLQALAVVGGGRSAQCAMLVIRRTL